MRCGHTHLVAEAEIAVVEPAPPEAPPAEIAGDATPAKPAPKRRTKKADVPAEGAECAAPKRPKTGTEPVSPAPVANDMDSDDDGSEPRRGWWQRTFG